MKSLIKHAAVLVLATVFGFGAVVALFRKAGRGLEGRQEPAGASSLVILDVEVKDAQGRPLRGADVLLAAENPLRLGKTDEKGRLRGKVKLQGGRIHTLEARIKGTRIRQTFPVSLRPNSQARVLFRMKKSTLLGQRKARAMGLAKPHHSAGAATSSIRIDVFHGPGGDKKLLASIAKRVREMVSKDTSLISTQGAAALQIRQLWNEASYVEIVPVTRQGLALGGYLLRSHKADEFWLRFALRNMWSKQFQTNARGRALRVVTNRPGEARAYLNGIPLPRRIDSGSAVFDLSNHPAARTRSAILTLTSNEGPLIRSAVDVARLSKDIRWVLPDSALSQK